MNTTKIVVALVSSFLFASATAAQPPKTERPIDAADLAAFERILETLENGGKVCQREMVGVGGHLLSRPCMEGKDLQPEEWAALYENLRKLKACVASAKPCMPKKEKKPKDETPAGKVRVYNAY